MPSVKARLSALSKAAQARKQTPYEAYDPLSKALVDSITELSAARGQGLLTEASNHDTARKCLAELLEALQ